MTLNLLKLASQGRAFDATRPYTAEELESLLAMEKGLGLTRREAAEYVRNGILTVEDVKKAKEAGVEPKSLEEVKSDAVIAHQEKIKALLGDSDPSQDENDVPKKEDEEVVTSEEKKDEEVVTSEEKKDEEVVTSEEKKDEEVVTSEENKNKEEGEEKSESRIALEAKATALGISFQPHWKDETLQKKIDEINSNNNQ